MSVKPRSLYDIEPYGIFGYLMPGAALLAGVIFHWDYTSNWLIDGVFKATSPVSATITGVIFISISYGLGHIISALSGLLLDSLFTDKWIGYPMIGLTQAKKTKKWLKPIKYYLEFSDEMRIKIFQIYENKFGHKPTGGDFYWTAFSTVANQSAVAQNRILGFVGLYGFSRNMCVVMFLLAFLPSHHYLLFNKPLYLWILICLLSSLMFLLNYMKLLKRCNGEICTHFLCLNADRDSPSA